MKLRARIKAIRGHLMLVTMGIVLGGALFIALYAGLESTSTDAYCESCHVHPQATGSWKQGSHFKTASGMQVGCVQCHLPPEGTDHYIEKFEAAARDFYGYYFTDTSAIDWDAKSSLEQAAHHTFDSACSHCHQELFPLELSDKGVDAHLHFRKQSDEVRCINCHLTTGHFHDQPDVADWAPEVLAAEEVEEMAPPVDELDPGQLADYSEIIPGSRVRFEMVAIQGGRFLMGSPPEESGRLEDEGPQREVEVGSFWMGKFEVSWDEFQAYYSATVTRGKNETGEKSDAITGPTPPYGSPDQGWGKGRRPAITMTHYAATKYCEWLSAVTGRHYRLPTEAEWEFAARAGTTGPVPFADADERGWFSSLFSSGVSPETIGRFSWFADNSQYKTRSATERKEPNAWGLYNMFGNVREFCSDRYSPDALGAYPDGLVTNPKGPEQGDEHVVRGGSYKSGPQQLRSAARDHTRHWSWLKTDPQTPKSVWWYSDSTDVGLRVVREFEDLGSPERGGNQ